ncbi:hypothetical protein NDU88_006833 [Pleurodeles waltl]|uniref:Uncharacterized protein n=1 Tax=Pleurodeles waltl TaxID=8319 RepID=A0AAV7PN13_PLEWA|nr:hypothetical protein NDU88_006833 [Pleurodeles waltl]
MRARVAGSGRGSSQPLAAQTNRSREAGVLLTVYRSLPFTAAVSANQHDPLCGRALQVPEGAPPSPRQHKRTATLALAARIQSLLPVHIYDEHLRFPRGYGYRAAPVLRISAALRRPHAAPQCRAEMPTHCAEIIVQAVLFLYGQREAVLFSHGQREHHANKTVLSRITFSAYASAPISP